MSKTPTRKRVTWEVGDTGSIPKSSAVQQEQEVGHIYNFKFSSSHIRKGKDKQVKLIDLTK